MSRSTWARQAVRRAGLFVVLLGAGCASADPLPRSPRRFLTSIDGQEGGQIAVEAFLDDLEESEREALRSVLRLGRTATARLAVTGGTDSEGGEDTALGSCVLLDDGKCFLTAAHVLSDLEGSLATIVLADGRRLRARERASGHPSEHQGDADDWAILESAEAPGLEGRPVARRRAEIGELVVLLGFPQGTGLGSDGHVRGGVFDDRRRLDACALIARVHDRTKGEPDSLVLEPLAGSLNSDGMSGGPVLDASGRILGIFRSSIVVVDDGGVAVHRLGACSADDFASRLGSR